MVSHEMQDIYNGRSSVRRPLENNGEISMQIILPGATYVTFQ